MKRYFYLGFATLVLAILIIAPGLAFAANPGSIGSVEIKAYDATGTNEVNPKTLKEGDTFVAKVIFNNASELRGVDILLEFDKDILEVTSAKLGSFFDTYLDPYQVDPNYGGQDLILFKNDPSKPASRNNSIGWVKCVFSITGNSIPPVYGDYTWSDYPSSVAILEATFKVKSGANHAGYIKWDKATVEGGSMAIGEDNQPINLEGKITQLSVPQAGLKTITLDGNISSDNQLSHDESFNLTSALASSALTLAGKDQFGQTYDITGLPVTWNSSNTSVASVTYDAAAGYILKAVSAGTTDITATVEGVISNAITVTVLAPPALTALKIEPADPITLKVSESYNLSTNLKVYGQYTGSQDWVLLTSGFTWESTNTAVASVSDGMLQAKQAGTAKLSVKAGAIESNKVDVTVNYPLSITSFTAKDLNGNTVTTCNKGGMYNFEAAFEGTLPSAQKLLMIVQLKGSDGTVYNIGSFSKGSATNVNESIGAGFTVPNVAGTYTVEAYIWSKWPAETGIQWIWAQKQSMTITVQ